MKSILKRTPPIQTLPLQTFKHFTPALLTPNRRIVVEYAPTGNGEKGTTVSYTIQLGDLSDTEKVYRTCASSPDPIFITANGQEEMVLLNFSVYKSLFAKLQVYERLEEGETDIADGRESDAFEMLNRIGARAHV